LGYKSKWEPPLELREKFRYGIIMEDETAHALKGVYGDQLVTQFPLRTKQWSGKADMVISPDSHSPILIEHKATNDSSLGQYSQYIPRDAHVAQLVLYGQLFSELYDKDTHLILVYRSWSHYAEFEVEDRGDFVFCKGELDGNDYQKDIPINVTKAREYLEKHFALQQLPDYKKLDECEFQGVPSCGYHEMCHSAKWGDF